MTQPQEPAGTPAGTAADLLPGQWTPRAARSLRGSEAAVPATSAPSPALPRPREAADPTPAGRPAPGGGAPASTDRWEAHPWRTVVRVTLSRALLGVLVGLLLWAVLPLGLGWTPRVILSGSMEPRISTGDVVVTREASPERLAELAPPTVVTTDDPDKPGRTRTHRVVERDEAGLLVTQGDANPEPDSTPVPDAAVLGIGVIRVPFVGLPAYWVAVRETVPLGIAFVVLSGLVLGSMLPAAPNGGGRGRPGRGSGDRRGRRAGHQGRIARTAGAGAVVMSLVAVPLGAGSATYAAFAAPVGSGGSVFSAAAAFAGGYAATVAADGPRLHWRMDEGSGAVVPDAAGSYPASVSGGQYAWGQSGALASEPGSGALAVNGAVVQQSGTVLTGRNWSVELWVRVSGGGGPLMTLFAGGGINRAVYLGNDGLVRLGTGSGTAQTTGSTRVNDGHWHHVVVTGTQGSGPPDQRARIYVDGRQDGVGRNVENDVTGSWRAAQAQWGNNVEGGPDQFFRGSLDEVAVYDHTLAPQRVSAHYAAAGY